MTEYRIAIVGSAADKFIPETEAKAREIINSILTEAQKKYGDGLVMVSGGCHLGGVDIFSEEESFKLKIKTQIYKPQVLQWNRPGTYGFKKRNRDIAEHCNELHVVVPAKYPDSYTGFRYKACYHCGGPKDPRATDHIKTGGDWTANVAIHLRKKVYRHIIDKEVVSYVC